MEDIISTITGLLGTLLSYVKTLAVQFGLDSYLDAILGLLGLGGEDVTEAPVEDR